jgi:O-glycosyl hydrolase
MNTYRAATRALAPVLLSLLLAIAVRAQGSVTPILECVINFGNGYQIAIFRYENPDRSPVIAQMGADNFFTPEVAVEPPQILRYTPRPDSPNVRFEVPFAGDSLTWTLLGQSVTASAESPACEAENVRTITVDPEVTHQTITGFGGAYVYRFSKTMDQGRADEVAALTLETLRPTHLRFDLPLDTWEPTNDNNDPTAINGDAFVVTDRLQATFNTMQLAEEREAVIHASVWAVPDWMVVNPDAQRQRIVAPEMVDEFVESVLALLLKIRDDYGVTVDTISVNEPDLGIDQLFTPAEQVDLIRRFSARFSEEGVSTGWAMGETSNMKDAQPYTSEVWADESVRDAIRVWSYHSWDAAVPDSVLSTNADWAQQVDRDVWVTELGFDPASWETPEVFATYDYALNTARIYSRLYKLSGMNVPFHWQLIDDYRVASPDLTTTFPTYDLLRGFRAYIPIGSQVIDTSADSGDLHTFAVQAPDGAISLFLLNISDTTQAVEVAGLPAGSYRHLRMSESEALTEVGVLDLDGDAPLFLMARSINWLTTIVP